MKRSKWLLSFVVFHFAIATYSQSPDQNWVKSKTYKQPTTTAVNTPDVTVATTQVSYFDGLGRPIQQVAHKQSNTGKDIVTHIEYDAFGRQTKEYLPYANQTASLNYADATTVVTELTGFYSTYNGGTTNPYSEKQLESSPLNRVFKQAAPGNAWAMESGKEIKFDYQTNDNTDEVKYFKATATWNAGNELYNISISSPKTYYSANELYKTITKDENWKLADNKNNTTEEFKNKEGQVVLKRTYNQGGAHDTYYVYDQFGNLTYVLPPLAEGVANQTILDNLGYQYKYDYRNRLVEKKLPGKQWEFIVYDKLDRPVATGPAFTPFGGTTVGWMITQYDVFGRVTQTGWKQMAATAAARQTNQTSVTAGSNPFVLTTNDVLTKNYYDNYTYSGAPPVPTQIEGQNTISIAEKVRGLPTGSWTKVMDITNPNAAEMSYTIYDDRYRPIRTYTSNYLGGYTQVDSKLDWAGKTLYTITTHKYNASATVLTTRDTFEYTPQDKLSLHKQQINSLPEQLIASNTYDELGQLISKKVGGQYSTSATGLQTVDYKYNIRGWLKEINDVNNIGNDLFSFKISYNDPQNATALYNGNISETFWKTSSDNKLRKYNYMYDNLNRLLDASYTRVNETTAPNSYRETLSYDKNGNIINLSRFGLVDDASYAVPTDNLIYTYDTDNKNLLKKVLDLSKSPQGFDETLDTNSNGVIDTVDDYSYDANGNMISDQNKGITTIAYNHLNLPTKIVVGTNTIDYIYTATGQKVAKKVTQGTIITNTHYLAGGFQYKDAVLQFFPHAEGYVNVITSNGVNNYNYVFNYTDHLGNIRVSYGVDPSTGNTKILEENHYYPFGLKHSGYNMSYSRYQQIQNGTIAIRVAGAYQPNYNYKFNQKEYQDELGLNLYDYGARNYDPALGRWLVIDPLAEEYSDYSPYCYVYNDPIRHTDPDGRAPDDIVIYGANNSSLTIKTSLIDVSVDASSLVGDLGGNYSFDGDGFVITALDIVGVVDPTPASDLLSASLSADSGDWWGAGASILGAGLPYVGDIAKGPKIAKGLSKINDAIKAADKSADLAKAEARAAKLSKTAREGKDFTKAGKESVKDVNKAKNGGKTKCETCGTKTTPAKQSKKGVTPPKNETHVDHVIPKSKGGSGTPSNGQVLCRDCNLKKSNN